MNTCYTIAQSIARRRRVAGVMLPLLAGALPPAAGLAATLPVTNCNDGGSGSLRAAVAAAQSGDIVDLTALTCGTISLTTGELMVGVNDLSLQGPGADKLTITASAAMQGASIIDHKGTGTLRVDSLQISEPLAPYPYYVSCIRSAGSMYLNASTITSCSGTAATAASGFEMRYSTISDSYKGVLAMGGNISIRNSTIANNSSWGCSGFQFGMVGSVGNAEISNSTISGNYALFYENAAGCTFMPTTITSSTIANNRSTGMYPGLMVSHAALTIESSILANNVSHLARNDLLVYSGSVSGHNNLITATKAAVPPDTLTVDPQLLPLASNGGPTLTHALAPTSPAIDAGSNSADVVTDQRGAPFTRVAGARADIGAFELQSVAAAPVSIGPGFTGSWYDPNQSGQGLTLEVLGGKRLYATWFAFDPSGKQAWFTGVGTYDGNTAAVTQMLQPQGARWIPNFHSADVLPTPWGSLTFSFSDCNHGRVDFDSTVAGFGNGHMDLTRLTIPAGLTCP